MARLSIEQRIAQLEARKQALKARLTTQERARDTRRKVLLGALLLDAIENGKDQNQAGQLRDWISRELPGFLTRPVDRTLFPEFIEPSDKPAEGDSQ